MHPADITAILRKSGFSISTLAELAGVTRTAVGNVINGRSRSAAIEQVLSSRLSVPLHILWPQYYRATDEPTPARKEAAPDPLEQLLIAEFRKLDLARKARALQFVTELSSETRSQAPHVTQLNEAARLARMNADNAKRMTDEIEAQSSTSHFAKMLADKEAQTQAELAALRNKPVMPSGTQQSASVIVHGNSDGNQFHDNRGSSAPMTFNMGKKGK